MEPTYYYMIKHERERPKPKTGPKSIKQTAHLIAVSEELAAQLAHIHQRFPHYAEYGPMVQRRLQLAEVGEPMQHEFTGRLSTGRIWIHETTSPRLIKARELTELMKKYRYERIRPADST